MPVSKPDFFAVACDEPLSRARHKRLHAHLLTIMVCLPTDFEPWGERSDDERGSDCSCGCRWYATLNGPLGADWGVCTNPASPRCGLLTFEHQGCPEFEASPKR